MSRRGQWIQATRRALAYWPHAGVALGLAMNVVGGVLGGDLGKVLLAMANNLLMGCGLFLTQRLRNEKKGD